MPDSRPKSISRWQRGGASDLSPSGPVDSITSANSEGGNEPRKELLELASEWLNHEDIKDESTNRKMSFLREKGLTEAETHELLGVPPETDPSEDVGTREATQSNVRFHYKLTEASDLTGGRYPYRLQPPPQLQDHSRCRRLSQPNPLLALQS